MKKLLIHIAPRPGAHTEVATRVQRRVAELIDHEASGIEAATALFALDKDPLRTRNARYSTTLEVRGGSEQAIAERVPELLSDFEDIAHPDLCTALLGEEHTFIEPGGAPLRYQYLMRRNAEFDHAGYIRHYRDVHSRFGIATPAIEGYVQFHVDPEGSRRLAARTGAGLFGVDSVTQLHMRSVEKFIEAISASTVGIDAMEDEKHFVDRENSVGFTSRTASPPNAR